MEFVSNNLTNFPHLLTDPLPNPIWNFMEDLIETKAEGGHEFDTFLNETLQQSDSENDSVHNTATEQVGIRSSVSEDEASLNFPVTQEIGTQMCFSNELLSQDPSFGSCYGMNTDRFEWSGFEQPAPPREPMVKNPTLVECSPMSAHRRSSLPGDVAERLTDYPDMTNGRKRVFSWGDLDSTSAVLHDLDLSRAARRLSVNIPLQNTKSTFVNVSNTHSKVSPEPDRRQPEMNSPKTDETNESDSQQNVVEKRLNRRRERNRLAARRSREKRTQFLRDLEGLNQALRNENNALKAKLCDVLQELEALRAASLHPH
ncbi:hypothetical protein K493DRAFT_314505 [Basidiobolus meristosporus CBS 931.73]|uniref:BZIP domain-containing protein n=1 Tax=Basidiobolus meristosporus CBS 931.73 TaxID=1314790 RepID=A0A1Y1YER3_9FUNG|nr:hypothetical protein K493DRAFT_314505 [Basidiobolus meristosporus CBS 931.73]|eukprot:ORX96448.1 hypothetical protein K493DRAFT_314505 [Basidiobolus meristosporus CBS 931.73]